MPYADVEKRRRFQRRYKKAWRRRQAAKINPLKAFKIYISPRFPHLWVGRIQFYSGFLVTDDINVQIEIEQHPEFARHIFPVSIDMDLVCPLMGDDDD